MEISSSACRDLPDEILTEILLRLPVRSIVRFRSVCKSWRSLTSDPSFIEAYRRCGPTETSILMKPISYRVSAGSLDVYHVDVHRRTQGIIRMTSPADVTTPLLLAGSCDDLFCFREDPVYKAMPCYHVCNLATKEWTAVPCSPHWYDVVRVLHLAMYYHRPSGEYRLLECILGDYASTAGFQVFSLGGSNPSWTWRSPTGFYADDALDCAMKWAFTPHLASVVSVCGCVHWLPDSPLFRYIMAFDVEAEKFRVMSTPAGPESEYDRCAFEMKGSLGLSQTAARSDATEIELWLLEDYEREEWVRLHTVSLQSISRTLPYVEDMTTLWPLIIVDDGERNEVLFRGRLYLKKHQLPRSSSSFLRYNAWSYDFFFVYDLEGEQTKHLEFDRSFDQESPLYDETDGGDERRDTAGTVTLWTQPLSHLLR